MKLYLLALYRNLLAGARLALFMPVRALDFRASPLDFVLLVAFNFALWIAVAALRTGMAGEFDSAAIALYLAAVPLTFRLNSSSSALMPCTTRPRASARFRVAPLSAIES